MSHENAGANQKTVRVCPVCGTALGEGGEAGGLCPRCLLEGVAAATEAGEGVGSGSGSGSGVGRPGLPDAARLAEVFPDLEIHGLVGAGGMGAVYKARQPHLDRWVALKVLPESLGAHAAFVERFHREARTLARLNHPNIVTVHDFGRRGGYCYLLMEYVDGVNLRQAMRAGRFTPEQALGMVPRICEALQFAHEEGVLHRDIKPENILLDGRGRVKIADFGIAKLVGEAAEDPGLTVSGAALGTPAYMAPEQIENPSQVDHRADIYSLGVVLYEMLTGELPLGRFAPPSEKAPLDRRVDEIVMRALAKERELRQQSAAQVRTEVEGVSGAGFARGPGAGLGAGGKVGGEDVDYVLCHPWLPRMGQWLTVYALVVAPVMWVMGLSFMEGAKDPSPYVQMLVWLQNALLVVGDGVLVGLMFAGGLKLRALRVAGPRMIAGAIWGRIGLGVVVLGLVGLVERLGTSGVEEELGITPADGLLAVTGVAAMVFEVASLVWLRRNRHRLALVFARSAPASEDAAMEVALTAPVEGVAGRATLAAVLTSLSVVFGLAGMGGGSMLVMAWVQDRMGNVGGLGPVEIAMGLVGLVVVGGGGVTGAVLGWGALRAIRESGRKLGGLGRGLVAALAWPVVLVEALVLVVAGWVFFRVGGATMLTMLLALVAALGAAELVVRGVWRWVCGVRPGQRAGRLPGSARGLVVGSALVVFAALFPAYSVSWANHLRSRIPAMEVVMRPDGGVTGGGVGEWAVGYPPRGIVWVTATVYRDGVQLAEPRYTAHVVNGSVWESDAGVLRVAGSEALGGEVGVWRLEVGTGRHTVAFRSAAEDSRGVWWRGVTGGGEGVTVGVGSTAEVRVLEGESGETRWEVRVGVRVEPLSPEYLFEGALAGEGLDWRKTAAYGVSLEEGKGDE